MVDLAAFSRFDVLSVSDIKKLGSAKAVASRLATALAQVKAQAAVAVDVVGHTVIQNRLVQIPDCLNSDFAKAPKKLGLQLPLDRRIVT